MSIRKYSALLPTMALCAFGLCAGNSHAAGRIWSVANDGTDSPTCGDRAKPCRSISQAIGNAAGGDTISVGAGVYGDLTGDGTYSHPGDEHPGQTTAGNCIVCIDRPVQIVSLHGASVHQNGGKTTVKTFATQGFGITTF